MALCSASFDVAWTSLSVFFPAHQTLPLSPTPNTVLNVFQWHTFVVLSTYQKTSAPQAKVVFTQ
ncbi:hypothetical protein BLGI_2061 [Brevibacillus laterosporus GI-9]|nr:hypothetical protein BLGI_2061 [Brevibacillus laterosporus GI-9]